LENNVMINSKKVSELHSAGFNCAQVVAVMCRELSGVDEKTALAAMGGFGGGMRCGEVCGAVSGGVYALGNYCPYTDGAVSEVKMKIAELTKSFTAAFKDEFGTLLCRDLTSDGSFSLCEGYMERASKLIMEIIERDKQNGDL